MPSPSQTKQLTDEQLALLLSLARQSIQHGLEHGCALPASPDGLDQTLRQPGACFVTLQRDHQLRGCIGSLQAHRPLIEDICHNAYAAAFLDPRFAPLQTHELADLDIHISILNPAEVMHFTSEQDLLNQLRPNEDGLIIEAEGRRATFLPSVWEQLPTADIFLQQLKYKAGLANDYWSDEFKAWRYTTTQYPH